MSYEDASSGTVAEVGFTVATEATIVAGMIEGTRAKAGAVIGRSGFMPGGCVDRPEGNLIVAVKASCLGGEDRPEGNLIIGRSGFMPG